PAIDGAARASGRRKRPATARDENRSGRPAHQSSNLHSGRSSIMRLSSYSLAAALLSLGLGAGAASAADGLFGLDAPVIEAAKAEGALTFYSAQAQDLAERTAAAFEEAFPGVEVNIIRAASGTLANRLSTEYEAGVFEADAIDISNLELFQTHPDWFVP